MEPYRSEPAGWDCPSCGRRVPGRIQECRCGFVQPAIPLDPGTAADAPVAAQPRGLGLPLLAVGLALGLGLSFLPAWGGRGATPTQASARVHGLAQEPQAVRSTAGTPDDSAPDEPTPVEPPDEPEPAKPPANSGSLEDLVSRVVPAVASIQAGSSRGTGFFIQPDRLLTNAHVVEGQTTVKLQVGEASYSARVVGLSPANDLAVLQVNNPNPTQPTLSLGSVTSARVGQEVIAVGSALGVLSNTVTRGIVSAVRQVGEVTLIQTDAAINPGNSGGPLIDRKGLVIGVNSLRVAQRAEGVAFAVAIDHASMLLAGKRTTATETPLKNLTQMLSSPSDGDTLRAQGEQTYARVLEWAAKNADELDRYWNQYAGTCVATAARAGDRAWFAAFQAGGVALGTAAPLNCGSWFDNVRQNAGQIKSELDKASEAARQQGVYPGVMRDLRRRHRLTWTGWDR
jgi:S1-C subfamily serine protease